MNTDRVDKELFSGAHYLGKPADFTDRIITRRVDLVKQVPGFCSPNLDLVEVGCGNGSTMILLSGFMKNITGLELFEGHRAAFEVLQKQYGAANCRFVPFNIEKEKYPQQFDRLISFEVIEHLASESAVKSFADLLKPGGMAVFSVPNKGWIFETHGAKLPLLPWNRVPFFSWLPRPLHERWAHARIYTRRRIGRLLEDSGFSVKEMRYITAPMDVLKEGALKRWLLKNIFRTDTTKYTFKSTSIFIVAVKKG